MRVLHLIPHFDYGGAENQVADLVSALDGTGHNVTIAARRGRRCHELPRGVTFRPIRYTPLLRSLAVHRLRRVIANEGIELIHAHQREPTIVGALLGRSTRTPVVATLQSQFDWDLDLEWVRPHIGCLVVVSDSWARTVKRFDEDLASRTYVVPNGIAAPRLSRERFPQRIVYASRLDRFHADALVALMSEALPRVAQGFGDVELLVAGDGSHVRPLSRLAQKTNALLGYDAVQMLGYRADTAALYAEAGLVLGVGRVALEALGQAAPVVLVNDRHLGTTVTPETLDECAHTNFVPVSAAPPDGARLVAETSQALMRSRDNQRLATELCEAVRERFGMDSVLSATEHVYQQALLSKP